MNFDDIVTTLATAILENRPVGAVTTGERWQALNAERMGRLDRLTQVVSSNLGQAEVLSPDLECEALVVQREAQALQDLSGRVDAQLAILREAILARTRAEAHLQALQSSLPKLLEGALAVCQIHRINDVELWLRRDAVVREVCAAVGCTIIDPVEGEPFNPQTMRAEQSEFTYDAKLAGRICRCLMPGLLLQRRPEGAPELIYPAQVCTYSVE